MKSQPVEFLDVVEHDLNYAQDFYDLWLTDGAAKFLSRFREAVTWIERRLNRSIGLDCGFRWLQPICYLLDGTTISISDSVSTPPSTQEVLMKNVLLFLSIGATAVTIAIAKPGDSVTPSQDAAAARAAIDKGHETFMAAMNADNTDALLAPLAADAVFMPPNEATLVGTAAIRRWHETAVKQAKTLGATVPNREVILVGDWAIESGNFTWRVQLAAGGAPVEDKGKFVAIWHRQPDGSWRVQRDIWNSSLPLPPNPPPHT